MVHSEFINVNLLSDKSFAESLTSNTNKFYLLPTNLNDNCPKKDQKNLCDIIEMLSKNSSDKSALTRMRIAYDVVFSLPTELCRGNSEHGMTIKSLAELLDKLEYDDNLILKNAEEYHVVIDDEKGAREEAAREVAKLFQQMVFLGLNLDIKMKSEIEKALIKDRFRANYTKLNAEIGIQKSYLKQALEQANLTESGKKRVGNMAESFDHMIEELEKARKRPIRIAAMGTKKAGKSVVINSLLKCDYAPTSSELPTPNVIKYIPADSDAPLTLDYGEKKGMVFNSAKELSDFIGNEFLEAQKHTGEGSGLADMIIHYPSDELNGYEVWDTPGPNFAGAGEEHHKIADECIKEADVCIFVMNYSNHLTDDEVGFLQKIHKTFKEENKFYSLFITVNRIDERYAAEVEKSVNRILDYIRLRLEGLDYKNIIIFGTSALQSFCLDKVVKLLAEDGEKVTEDTVLSSIDWDELFEKHGDYETPIDFVDSSAKKLKRFHKIPRPDVKTLENFSGIPQLWHHVRYIGEQKVDTEIVDHVVSGCEMEFDKINNALLVTELRDLSEEDSLRLKELQEQLTDLKVTVEESMAEVTVHDDGKQSVLLRAAKGDIIEQMTDFKRDAINSALARSNEIIKRAELNDDDVEKMQQKSRTDNVQKLLMQIDEILKGANGGSEKKFLKLLENEGEKLSECIEKKVGMVQERIVRKTEEVKKSVASDSVAGNMMRSFAVPQFPVSLNKLSSTARGLNIDITNHLADIAKDANRIDKEVRKRIVTRERESEGLWEGFCSFFGKKYYEDVEEFYTVNVIKADADKFKNFIQQVLRDYIKAQLDDSHEVMKKEVMDNLDEIYLDLGEQCQQISNTYKQIFDTFAEDINNALDETSAHKQAIDHDIEVLMDIKENVQPFFDLWHGILSGKTVG